MIEEDAVDENVETTANECYIYESLPGKNLANQRPDNGEPDPKPENISSPSLLDQDPDKVMPD